MLLKNDKKNKITVKAFIIQYLNDYAKPNLRKGTTKNHESILRLYIIPNIGDIKLQEIRPLHIQQLQNTLLKSSFAWNNGWCKMYE